MKRTQSEAVQRAAFGEAAAGMHQRLRAWRRAHPRASFDEIAEQVSRERQLLVGSLLEELAAAPESVPLDPTCPHCGGQVENKGRNGLVSRWVAVHRALCPPQTAARTRRGARPKSPAPELPPRFKTPSVRAATWLLVADPAGLEDDQAQFVAQLHARCPEVESGRRLIDAFLCLVRERDLQALDDWFRTVEASKLPELVSFAAGLRRDEAAVRAALRLSHSNGQVEGQINKLKLLKRSMYGQARFDLLKHRLLAA